MDLLTLYPTHFQALARYAARMTGSRADGEDVAQETFLRAMAHIDTLMGLTDGQQKAWLYTTARRIVIDRQRHARRAPPLEESPVWQDDLSWPEVEQLLAALPAQSAQIVRMRHLVGMTSSEIGKALGLPAPTVRTRLRAAMLHLKRSLEEQEED